MWSVAILLSWSSPHFDIQYHWFIYTDVCLRVCLAQLIASMRF
jgi:hypothetical protein